MDLASTTSAGGSHTIIEQDDGSLKLLIDHLNLSEEDVDELSNKLQSASASNGTTATTRRRVFTTLEIRYSQLPSKGCRRILLLGGDTTTSVLRHLSITGGSMRSELNIRLLSSTLRSLTHLACLELSHIPLQQAASWRNLEKALQVLPHLVKIRLHLCNLTDESVNVDSSTTTTITNTLLSDDDDDDRNHGLVKCIALEDIDLTCNHLRYPLSLLPYQCVHTLTLDDNSIGQDSFRERGLTRFSSLRHLNVSRNELGSGGLYQLLHQLPAALCTLKLESCWLGHAGGYLLSDWIRTTSSCTTATTATNPGSNRKGITTSCKKLKASAPCGSQLEGLYVGDNALGDVGVLFILRSIKEASCCCQIQILELQSNGMTDQSVRVLADMIIHRGGNDAPPTFPTKTNRLKELDLSNNQITLAGWRTLAQSVSSSSQNKTPTTIRRISCSTGGFFEPYYSSIRLQCEILPTKKYQSLLEEQDTNRWPLLLSEMLLNQQTTWGVGLAFQLFRNKPHILNVSSACTTTK